MSKLGKPIIRIDPDEELNLICNCFFTDLMVFILMLESCIMISEIKDIISHIKKFVNGYITRMNGKSMLRHRKIFHELVMVKFHVRIAYICVIYCALQMISLIKRHINGHSLL